MKIRSLTTRSGLFAGEPPIEFNPGTNILRGANGIGKTIILEYASLLGHVAIMPFVKPRGNSSLVMLVSLSASDRQFLKAIAGVDPADGALARFDLALKTIGWSVKILQEAEVPASAFELKFSYPTLDDDDLKEILADEARIRDKIHVYGEESQVRLVQALSLWSRPSHVIDGQRDLWDVTPRFLRAAGRSGTSPQPAPVFYVNTDMYEFGTGLDIRESPKHLREKMTSVLVDRLQLVPIDNVSDQSRNLSEMLVDQETQSLFCDENLRQAWTRIFGEEHPFRSGEVQCGDLGHGGGATTTASSKVEWSIKIGNDESAGFVSSGENQALFLLAMLYGLADEGSCMLLDEPELHLTFGAGSLLMEEIIKRANLTRSQAIIVTHLPHLYRSRVVDQPAAWDREDDYDYGKIRMIYIGRDASSGARVCYDVKAVNHAARASHADVMKVVEGLLLKQEVLIFPWLATFLSWLKRVGRRRAENLTGGPASPAP